MEYLLKFWIVLLYEEDFLIILKIKFYKIKYQL